MNEACSIRAFAEHRIAVHHENAVDLPFPGDSFTHVLSIEGPQHFDTREAFFHEACRVLKPGGVMVLADYTLKRQATNALERAFAEFAFWLWKVPRQNCYGHDVYRRKLEVAGFRNITLADIGEDVIPGYCREERRTVREAARTRGWIASYLGIVIDLVIYSLWRWGILEYTIVRAEK